MLIVSLPTKDDLPIKWEMNINNACELYVKCSQISLISNFFLNKAVWRVILLLPY